MPPLEVGRDELEEYTPFDFSALDDLVSDSGESHPTEDITLDLSDFSLEPYSADPVQRSMNNPEEPGHTDDDLWDDANFAALLSESHETPNDPAEAPSAPEDAAPRKQITLPPLKMPSLKKEKPEASGAEAPSSDPRKKLIVFCIFAVALFLAVAGLVISLAVSKSDPYGNKILKNVSVAGIDVGGMTKGEAVRAVKDAIGDSYAKTDMVVNLPGETLVLSPSDIGVSFDAKSAVAAAFSFGRTGTAEEQREAFASAASGNYAVELLPYLNMNTDKIRSALEEYASQYSGKYVPSGYALDGEMPSLDPKSFDENTPCQTLVLTVGTPGFCLDMDSVFQQILECYNSHTFVLNFNEDSPEATPAPLDLDAIFREVTIDPVEPVIDRKTFSSTTGSYGYTFDLAKAKSLVSKAGYGDTLSVPMEYDPPKLVGDEVYFQDVLGYCLTPHGANENRNANLRLACAALNGLVIQPGETISYNETLGERTAENGYKPAPAYSGTNLVDSIGGGICQVSSTLYLASLFAELETVDRINHGYPVNYIPPGLDATVSWGSPDLKIKNDSHLPVKIVAEEADGFVKIWIMGTELRDYTVKMEFSAGGRYAIANKLRFNAEGEQILKEMVCRSAYMNDNLSAAGKIGSGEAYINGMVKTPDVSNLYSGGSSETK